MAEANNNSNKNNSSHIQHRDSGHVVGERAAHRTSRGHAYSRRPPHNPPKTSKGNSGNKK